ncbi:uncharacterized protein LOC125869989 [Solanum stenotomum]|uniref:uncharacterized protein LOC125869989 n=1 Tax=Solanum stenotomum TaxID=172797 RepID=UPI0020D13708|nr:uncharacterized protein LOC125869989 [Solanum stenotomum]
MHDYINAEGSELWDIILDGPYIPTKEMKDGELTTIVVKTRKDYNEADRKKIEKNYKAKKILAYGIGADEYNRISACETANEIWDCLQTTHEGTQRVKESKVDMLTTQYENFIMKEGETIFEMNSRFTSITNELRGLGKPIPVRKQIRKILKCGKPGHFMRNCPSQKQETHDTRPRKRDLVPDRAQRKAYADQLVRKAFAVRGNDSSESEKDVESHEDVSMMAIEDDESIFNSIFSLMANSDNEEDSDEVTLFYLKDDLDNLPIKNLRKLVALLIDCVDERTTENLMLNKKLSLCEDKNSALMSQVAEISERIGTLETCNITPEKNLGNSVGGKRKLSIFEEELEEKLKNFKSKLVSSLKTNSQLRKDLSKVKEELSHSLKWTDSSKILSNLSNQIFNGKKGLGRRPIKPPYNPHSKYVSVSDNLLSTHCGRNGHLKENCESLRKAKEKHVRFVRSENDVKKGDKGPGPLYRFSKNILPP